MPERPAASRIEPAARAAAALGSLLVLGAYLGFLDASLRPLQGLIAAGLALSLLSLLLLRSPARWSARLHDVQLALFASLLVLCCAEAAWRLAPGLFPSILRDRLQERDVEGERRAVVEYLDESPFVKFRANTLVRSQGYRGGPEDFVYEWRTDRRGFKNPPELAARDRVEVVAVGDSFTEGMGVSAGDAWPARLARAGHPTYNLGVQGYAPTQLAGAFRRYGLPLAPKTVIVGYCSSTFLREKAFLDEASARRDRAFTGGIQSFVVREIRQQRRFVTTALFESAYLSLAPAVSAVKSFFGHSSAERLMPVRLVDTRFQSYAAEIAAVPGSQVAVAEVERQGVLWMRALDAIRDIRTRAEAAGARVIVLYLPGRGESYFERATGRPLPETSFSRIESAALARFCRSERIEFLDPSRRLSAHVMALASGAPQSELPFLRLDGHLSVRGHALVAEELLAHLER